MNRLLLRGLLIGFGLAILLISTPSERAMAASCYGASCNWKDPYGTSCWYDAYYAVVRYGPSGSYFYNGNKYSPGCVANWSHTQSYGGYAYLAAQTYGVYTYHGPRPYLYVWNNMWDGRTTVCTRGFKGWAHQNYQWVTSWGCA